MRTKLENYCALAFDHVMIKTDGTYNVCCMHNTPADRRVNINKHNHDHWQNSAYVQGVRNSFLLDQRHPGCAQCWQAEDSGFDSQRTRCAKEYNLLPHDADRPVKNVEIDLGNLCNLRCLMCNESSSSAILAENHKLGINKLVQKDLTWSDTAYENLQTLIDQRPYVVNIRGGEPLYNKKLLEIVDNIPAVQARNMVLHITTNATVWDQKWHLALGKFRLIRFMFSVDAIGDLYEYIRYPASWQLVEENIQSMMSLPNSKCLVHCVGQNLNISSISSLIEWCEKHKIYLEIDNLVSPDYMQITNLPVCQKNVAVQDLKRLNHQKLEPHLAKFVRSAHDLLERTKFDYNLWQAFVANISPRDNLRGNSFRNFIMEEKC